LDAQEVSYDLERINVPHNGGILVPTAIDHKLQVAQVKDGGNQLASLCNVSLGQADGFQGNFELVESVPIVVAYGIWSGADRTP
jgi:hypothetical protein